MSAEQHLWYCQTFIIQLLKVVTSLELDGRTHLQGTRQEHNEMNRIGVMKREKGKGEPLHTLVLGRS